MFPSHLHDRNKADVYALCCQAADLNDRRKVGFSTLLGRYGLNSVNLLLMKPASDLCLKSQKHVHNKFWTLNGRRKSERLQHFEEHSKTQGDHHRDLRQLSWPLMNHNLREKSY